MVSQNAGSYLDGSNGPGLHPAPRPGGLDNENTGLLEEQNTPSGTVQRSPLLSVRRKLWSALSYKDLGLLALLLVGFLAWYFSNERTNAACDVITRKKWAVEDREHAERRLKIQHELVALEEKRAANEKSWQSEQAAMEEERRKWARERAEHDGRADEEKQAKVRRKREKREKEAKQRAGMAWAGLEPKHCLRYGVKEYTATLTHVPLGFNAIEECKKKLVEIHGKLWLPTRCEDQGICGKVTAHWEVNANESTCTPRWGTLKDKGCAESGIHRYEARLESIQDMTNWETLCSTTPTKINGIRYGGPTSCTSWGLYMVWGIWLVNDDTCP